ncbi:MAG: sulfatase [Colwellia sp.]|nr:sulfatase [Colwellia sp.]
MKYISLITVLTFGMLSTGCQIGANPSVKNVTKDKPNILWITIEDTSPHFIGSYGNSDAKTPVIDQLASKGIRFDNAFATGTVCSASRAAIITGVKTYKTGMGNHRSAIPVPQYMKGFPYYLQQQGYYTSNNKKTDYNVADAEAYTTEAWHESSKNAGWWNRQKDQPFFAVFNYQDSHQSRTMTYPYNKYKTMVLDQLAPAEHIGQDAFELPPFYNDTAEMRKQFARVYNSLKLTDNKVGLLLERLEKDGLKDNTIIFFYGDHGEGIPRGKTNGINLGYRVPFIAWFPEKYRHLSPWGNGGVVTNELVSFEDLAPTMISLAGGAVPEQMTGRVLIGDNRSKETDHLILSSDRADNGIEMSRTVTNGDYVYSRNFMPFLPQLRYIRYFEISDIQQHMRSDYAQGKLNELQKSLFTERPVESLYNIKNDKWELNNLSEDETHSELLLKMRQQLKNEMIKSKDIGLLPEYELADISKNTTPYEYRLTANYAIEDIVDSAMLSGVKGEQQALQQVKLLKHENKIVRYWAAVGLRSQNKTVLSSLKTQLTKAMDDDYPPVAITAAAIVYDIFNDNKAAGVLKQYCLDKNNDLALLTLHYMMYVDDKKPYIETVKSSRAMAGRNYPAKAAAADFLASMGLLPNTWDYRK